ncbi:MAG: ATP-binding protein [Saprospiraceae bacterium]
MPFGEKKAGVEPEVLILKDHSSTLTLHQAWNSLTQGNFQNMADFEKPGKFEFGQYNYWMAFVLENRSENPLDLVVQSPGMDTFWIKKKGDSFQMIPFPRWFPESDYLGKFPYKIKEINTFQVQPFQRDTLLFKLDHIRQFRIFVPLLSEVEAYKRQQLEATQYTNLFYLFFIGATFMVMLFSAAQYLQQRDPVFLWYALYLFSLIFVAWRIVEDLNPAFYLTYHFLPWSWTKVFHSAAHFVTYTLFIYFFLKQDDEFPAFMRPILRFVLGVSGIACLIELILMGSDLRYQSWLLYYAFRTVMTLFSFVFLFLLWRERNRLAQIILVGTLCAITGELISLFLTTPFSTFAGAIGVSSEIIFLTGGLAYRARLFREAHYRLQNEHIAQLEENVRLREIEKKEEVEAFKNLFYANITHEFRTPLTVILGMSESLRESTDTQVQKVGKLVSRNGRNLLNLVNQLLDLSKIESGKLQLQLSRADVMQFVKVNAEAFESLAEMKKQHLSVKIEPNELWADFDPDRLQQVLANLIGNAIKFTPEVGMITVTARFQENAMLEIEVRDTGIGISGEALPHVFKRFYQVEAPKVTPFSEGVTFQQAADEAEATPFQKGVTSQQPGSGIGLAFTDELVRLMGGRIEVESEVGKGSTFRVILPMQAQENGVFTETGPPKLTTLDEIAVLPPVGKSVETTHTPLPENEQIASGNPLLLLVEDNADLVQYLTTLLSRDYQLLTARNGHGGLEQAFEHLPDLVLSDVMMPGMDGLEFCKQLKNDPRTSHIPVVMLTARSAVEARIDGLQRGADAWLTKPFHRAELFATLAAMLESRKRLQVYFQQQTSSPALPEAALAPLIEKENEFLTRIRSLIDDHLADEEYGIEALCRDLAMSRMQVHRKLTALGGQSAALFIRSHRLHHARQLLENTRLSVSEIAYNSGFSDPAYFTRCFKEEFGKAPSEWKKQ